MSRLVTPSLASSVSWLQTCPPDWRDKARTDLERQLARDYSAPRSPELDLGIRFENAVYSAAAKKPEDTGGSDFFKQIVAECRGGQFQRRVRKIIEINGEEVCIYGKMDVWFPEIIKDLKTTRNYGGRDRYLSSFQHKAYCFARKQNKFRYVVAEFEEEGDKIADVHLVDYEVDSEEALRKEVLERTSGILEFLRQDVVLWELYTTKFCLY